MKGLLPTLSKIVSHFCNATSRSYLILERIVQFVHEGDDAYHIQYDATTCRTQVSIRQFRPISVHITVRPTVHPTRTSTSPCIPRDNCRFVSFMERATDLSTSAYQPVVSIAIEAIFDMDDAGKDNTDSLPKVDHDSTTTEILHSDSDDEHLLIINLANYRPPSPRSQQSYVPQCDITHVKGMTMASHPGWRTGTKIIFHHCYITGHISPE